MGKKFTCQGVLRVKPCDVLCNGPIHRHLILELSLRQPEVHSGDLCLDRTVAVLPFSQVLCICWEVLTQDRPQYQRSHWHRYHRAPFSVWQRGDPEMTHRTIASLKVFPFQTQCQEGGRRQTPKLGCGVNLSFPCWKWLPYVVIKCPLPPKPFCSAVRLRCAKGAQLGSKPDLKSSPCPTCHVMSMVAAARGSTFCSPGDRLFRGPTAATGDSPGGHEMAGLAAPHHVTPNHVRPSNHRAPFPPPASSLSSQPRSRLWDWQIQLWRLSEGNAAEGVPRGRWGTARGKPSEDTLLRNVGISSDEYKDGDAKRLQGRGKNLGATKAPCGLSAASPRHIAWVSFILGTRSFRSCSTEE